MWYLLTAHQQESFLPFLPGKVSPAASAAWQKEALQNLVVLYSPSEPCGPFPHFRTAWSSLFHFRTMWPSLLWLPHIGFKSQRPSSSAAPFLTPPTISYTCQHSRILPALLGCHSKSGQVWPHSMEPIISTLSRRPCNQGELLPGPILGEFGPISLAHSMAAAI